MLALTLDVDWAPDPIVDEVVDLFDRAGLPLTIFATDPGTDPSGASTCLAGRYDARHEIALHPYFVGKGLEALALGQLLKLYPEARGFRSHHGCESWDISFAATSCGLDYHVLAAPFPVDVPPFRCPGGLRHKVLVNRFVDTQMWHEPGFDWSLARTWLAMMNGGPADELFIAAFHPAPIYYDCATEEEYRRDVHPRYHEVQQRGHIHIPVGPLKLVNELIAVVDPARCVTVSNGLARLTAAGVAI